MNNDQDQDIEVRDRTLVDELPVRTRRGFLRTAVLGVSAIGLTSVLAACGGDDDDVDDAVDTVESEGEDAVDDVQDEGEDAVDGAGDAVETVESEGGDAVDDVEEEVDDVQDDT